MPRGENILEVNKIAQFKSFNDIEEKTYPRPFSVRLPVSAAKKILELDTKERTLLMRRAILRELEEISN
jgi:hypothetical protein